MTYKEPTSLKEVDQFFKAQGIEDVMRDVISKYPGLPEFLAQVFPVRYHLQGRYWPPEYVIAAYYVEHQYTGGLPMDLLEQLKRDGTRVYTIDAGVLEDLRDTDLGDLTFGDLQWPLDTFILSLPKNFYLVPGLENEMGCDELCSVLVAKAPVTYQGVSGPGVRLLGVEKNGATVYSKTPLQAQADSEQPFERQALETLGICNEQDLKNGQEEAKALFRLVMNILAYMTVRRDVEPGEKKAGGKKRKKNGQGRDWWRPWHIGRDHVRSGSAPHARGRTRFHRRSGHWRRQAYGHEHSLRKLLWIEPTWIGKR